ncbi:MAG: serine hydrolase domain-containing protein, partial [Chitinophagales bacterium]
MKRYCAILLLVLCPLIVICQQVDNGRQLFNTRCDSFIPILMKKYNTVGFSMAVVDGNEPVLYKNYGYADLEKKIATNENTVFRIASVSKVFTAMSVMKLRDEGKVDLNAPVENYLDGLKLRYAPHLPQITVRDLLTHTSGLSDNIDNGSMCSTHVPAESIIAETNKLYLTIPAGLKMNYSNTGYALLGCLIEKVSGEKYEEYIRNNFFSPMEMTRTGVWTGSETIPNIAMGYLKDSTFFNEPSLRDLAAGGFFSTAADLTQLCRLIMEQGKANGKEVMPAGTMQEMMTDKTAEIKLRTDDEFGYGLFINNLGSDKDSLIGKNIGHGGDSRVFHSIVVAFPKLNIGFVLLTNSAEGGSFTKSAVLQIAREYIRDVKGIPIQRGIKSAFSLAAGEVDNLSNTVIAGTYGSGGEDFVTILEKNKQKLIFRQDKTKLVLQNNGSGIYSVKYMLFKFIPVKVKAASFGFRNIDENIYMKTLDNKSKNAEYISIKDKAVAMPESWKAIAGKYSVVNLCPGNMLLY